MPDEVMRCPLCQARLVIRYRIDRRYALGARNAERLFAIPLWYCTKHEFTVEINYPRRPLVAKRPKASTKRRHGSASERMRY